MALVPPSALVSDLDASVRRQLIAGLRFLCRHWLAFLNVGAVVFATLPLLAPILAALGANDVAVVIFQAYSITCHQMPTRSYFILGHQMAYCERNTAIYGTFALAGLAYVWLRNRRLAPLGLPLYLVLILPMAVDGFTQLFGWRESTWFLRGVTGALFGIASAWLVLPRLEENFVEIDADLHGLEGAFTGSD